MWCCQFWRHDGGSLYCRHRCRGSCRHRRRRLLRRRLRFFRRGRLAELLVGAPCFDLAIATAVELAAAHRTLAGCCLLADDALRWRLPIRFPRRRLLLWLGVCLGVRLRGLQLVDMCLLRLLHERVWRRSGQNSGRQLVSVAALQQLQKLDTHKLDTHNLSCTSAYVKWW